MMLSRKDNKKIDKKVNKISLGLLGKNITFWFGKNAVLRAFAILKSIIFCAMQGLYFESGLEELKNLSKDWIPQADIIHKRIKMKSKEEIVGDFMRAQDDILCKLRRRFRMLERKITVLIDKTEIPYWGDRNDEGVMGTKKQKGTSYCFKYITIHALIKNIKVCLHALPVTFFSDNAKQVEELLSVAKKKVRIGLVLMDREFANSRIINIIESHKLKYLAPIEKNDKIKKLIKTSHYSRNFYAEYEFENGIVTTVFFTKDKSKDFPEQLSNQYFSWCTNLKVNDANREAMTEIYCKRWNIENFYRDGKRNFLIKTKTKIFKVRLFFFLIAALLYNLWQLVRAITTEDITAQKWKSSVYEILYSTTKIWYSVSYEQEMWRRILKMDLNLPLANS